MSLENQVGIITESKIEPSFGEQHLNGSTPQVDPWIFEPDAETLIAQFFENPDFDEAFEPDEINTSQEVESTGPRKRNPMQFVTPDGKIVHFQDPTKAFLLMNDMIGGISISNIFDKYYDGERSVETRRAASALISKINVFFLRDSECFVDRDGQGDTTILRIRERTIPESNGHENQVIVDLKNERKKTHPTVDKIPELYLLSLKSFFDTSKPQDESVRLIDHYHSGEDARRFSRISLQTTINCLAVRVNTGEATEKEIEVWKQITGDIIGADDFELIDILKSEVRNAFPFPYEEDKLPDNTLSEKVHDDKLSIHESHHLARVISLFDGDVPVEILDKCRIIMDITNGYSSEKTPASISRTALKYILQSFNNEEDYFNFLDKNNLNINKIYEWLESNRPAALRLYLEQVRKDSGYFPRVGELTDLCNNVILNGQSEVVLEQAQQIEDEKIDRFVNYLLKDSTVPNEQARALLGSEIFIQSLYKSRLPYELKNKNSKEISDLQQETTLEKLGALKDDKKSELEIRIPTVREEVEALVRKHFEKNFSVYNIGQVLRTFGLRFGDMRRVQENGYIKPKKGEGKDYHPVLTPVEAIIAKFTYRRIQQFKPDYTDDLVEIILQKMEELAPQYVTGK